MPTKLFVFNRIEPDHINRLSGNLKNIFSSDSIESLMETVIEKMHSKQILLKHETKLALDWHHNLEKNKISLITDYFQEFVLSTEIFDPISEYFLDLKQIPVISLIVGLREIDKNLNQQQKDSFRHLTTGNPLQELSGDSIIDFIENLRLVPSLEFSTGQKLIASKFISSCDFSSSFETNFENLVNFAKKSDIQDDAVLIKFLDRQLVTLIKANESSVIAKAFRQELGFLKYIKVVENSIRQPSSRNLDGYQHLMRLISKFEEAIQILSEQEAVRGTFWKSNIQRLDGVKMKSSTSGKYKIGVAFFVGDFVFCDFGPTGNQIHIYDRDIFIKDVEHRDNWQNDEFLTDRLPFNKYPHQVHSWQDKTLKLINRTRNYG